MKLSECGRDVLYVLAAAPKNFEQLKLAVSTRPGPLSRCVAGLVDKQLVKITKAGIYSATAAGKKALKA